MLHFPVWAYRGATLAVYALALLRGGRPERILAGICTVLWIWGNLLSPYMLGERLPQQLAKDLALLGLIVALALRYDRWWLLVAGMTAVLWIATDLAGMLSPHDPWAFGTAVWTWNAIFLGALAAGTWASWRRTLAGLRAPPALR
jgi:hypothetical protein